MPTDIKVYCTVLALTNVEIRIHANVLKCLVTIYNMHFIAVLFRLTGIRVDCCKHNLHNCTGLLLNCTIEIIC